MKSYNGDPRDLLDVADETITEQINAIQSLIEIYAVLDKSLKLNKNFIELVEFLAK